MFEAFTNVVTRWVGSTPSIILHTIFFIGMFGLLLTGIPLDTIMLVLTTAVSLEAIYLALFIQRSVNINTLTLEEAAEDIQGIEEDIEEISEDVEGIEKDIEDIGDDMEEISEDIEEVGKDIDEMEEDIDHIQAASGPSAKLSKSEVDKLEAEIKDLKKMIATIAAKLDADK